MDYERIYIDFIADRKAKSEPIGYSEVHHILPRSLGGGDEIDNLIKLTADDHFFAHLLLAKARGGPMWHALNVMANGPQVGQRSMTTRYLAMKRRWYVLAKERFAREHSKKMKGRFTGEDHPRYGKPCPPAALAKLKDRIASGFNPMHSEEARRKVGDAHRGKVVSAETRAKVSAAKIGVRLSEETRAKMSASHKGKTLPVKTIEKIAAANRGKKRTPEQVAAMRARLRGRKLSPEHVAKLLPHLALSSRFKGNKHSSETRARMSAVNQSKKIYAVKHGCSPLVVTLEMMRADGIEI